MRLSIAYIIILSFFYDDCFGRPAESDKKQRLGNDGVMGDGILDRIFDYTGANNALLGASSSNIRAAHAKKFKDKHSVTVLGHARLTPEVVDDALKQGIERRTLLLRAIATNNIEIVEYLMRTPEASNINGFARSEIESLHSLGIFCSTAKSVEMLKVLHSHGFVCLQTAADDAMNRGDIKSVQWLAIEKGLLSDAYRSEVVKNNDRQFIRDLVSRHLKMGDKICDEAASTGQIEVLDLVNPMVRGKCSSNIYYQASKMNHPEVLKWAQKNRIAPPNYNHGGYFAAIRGDLSYLKWLKSKGAHFESEICEGAAAGGDLEVFAWAHDENIECNERVYFEAKMNGNDAIIERAKSYKIPFRISRADCETAAAKGKLEVIQWFKKQKAVCNPSTLRHGVRNGHLNIAEWAQTEGHQLQSPDIMVAAVAGHNDILEFAETYGYKLLPGQIGHLAKTGNMENIKWAYSRIEDPKERIAAAQDCFDEAAEGMRAPVPVSEEKVKEIMDWAITNGATVSAAAIEKAAESGASSKMLRRLVETKAQDISQGTAYYLARSGRVEMLRMAVENGAIPNIKTCEAAVKNQRPRVLQFLLSLNNEMSLKCRRLAALEGGVVYEWLKSQNLLPS